MREGRCSRPSVIWWARLYRTTGRRAHKHLLSPRIDRWVVTVKVTVALATQPCFCEIDVVLNRDVLWPPSNTSMVARVASSRLTNGRRAHKNLLSPRIAWVVTVKVTVALATQPCFCEIDVVLNRDVLWPPSNTSMVARVASSRLTVRREGRAAFWENCRRLKSTGDNARRTFATVRSLRRTTGQVVVVDFPEVQYPGLKQSNLLDPRVPGVAQRKH